MKVSNMYLPEYNSGVKCDVINLDDGFACRDPFIMRCGNEYYLYKKDKKSTKIVCHVSKDLKMWSDEITVYLPPKNFHGTAHLFWAPECHYYKGKYYIFTSVYSSVTKHRCISVYRADNPLGPFEDIAGGCITPTDWDAIDGTFYVDETGQPWMIFVHEWISMPDGNGSFVAAKLAEDLTHFISEPIHLFYAKELQGATMGVTDGCYMVTTTSGKLCMIWSNFTQKGYVVAKAYSQSGKIQGPWVQEGLLYQKGAFSFAKYEGGHGMVFQKIDGGFAVAYHSPNKREGETLESVQIKNLCEKDNSFYITE